MGLLQCSRPGGMFLLLVRIPIFLQKASLASEGCMLPAPPGEQGEHLGLAEEAAGACWGESWAKASQES